MRSELFRLRSSEEATQQRPGLACMLLEIKS